MSKIVKVNEGNFKDLVENSKVPVVLDFFAEWCGPCKMIGPVLEELAGEYGDKVQICKVDIDESGALAQKFNVRGVPTIMFFKNGESQNSLVGAYPKEKFKEEIDKII